jgi:hypothetical protein
LSSGAAAFVKLMQQIGYNKGLMLEAGTVIQIEPEIKIRLLNDNLILDQEDLAINEDLLPMTETVKIDGVNQVIEYPMQIKLGDSVLVANDSDVGQDYYVITKLKYL